jgi:hypothetical protein
MSGRRCSLTPFPSGEVLAGLTLECALVRKENSFSIIYTLRGPLAEVAIPPASRRPERKDGLWEETCFELFLATADSSHYREFNLSPAGHWNVYHFSSYRAGMQEETTITSLPLAVGAWQDALELSLDIDLDRIIPAGQTMRVGICAVLRKTDGGKSYWALAHHGSQPDFHRRDGFIIEL